MGSQAVSKRGPLSDWIHLEGGHALLRPLDHEERAQALGFSANASSLPDDQLSPEGFSFPAMELTGNSFSVHSIKIILAPLAHHWLTGAPLLLRAPPHSPNVSTKEAALKLLDPLQGNASR